MIVLILCLIFNLIILIMEAITMKTANEKVWAEVFGVELPAGETLKNERV